MIEQPAAPSHLAQSEATDWALCPFKAHARYVAGYRPGREETMPQRVGSMGHAILAEWARAKFAARKADPEGAVEEEMHKRGWSGIDPAEYERAWQAAREVAENIDLMRSMHLVPDLWGGSMGPLADVVVRVSWAALAEGLAALGLPDPSAGLSAVRARYPGIEGHPDLVCMPEGPAGPTVIIDYKFRQSIDLGGADGEVMSEVPDRQFAWYATLLRAAGLRPAGGIELWQVNAYAGAWATVDDFLRVAEGGAKDQEEHDLVTDSRLPTRDLKRLSKAGYAVTAEVWGEAHRLLANQRHASRLAVWETECALLAASGSKRRAPPRPILLTHHEAEKAQEFTATLAAQQPVVIRPMRPDPVVCVEVVRDMLLGVEGPLRLLASGLPPARHLQTYPRSACSRPGGCAVQPICLPTIGTYQGVEMAHRAATAHRLPVYGDTGADGEDMVG